MREENVPEKVILREKKTKQEKTIEKIREQKTLALKNNK